MSVDIEHVEIYNQAVDEIEGLFVRTQTIITAGDDGFVSIEDITAITKGHPRRTRVGLTPPMIAAIVAWSASNAKKS